MKARCVRWRPLFVAALAVAALVYFVLAVAAPEVARGAAPHFTVAGILLILVLMPRAR